MDASPRSSKRRRLDTPDRKTSDGHERSTRRTASARLASRTTSLSNGQHAEIQRETATPSKTPRSSIRTPRVPKATPNGTLRKRGRGGEQDLYDDIEGALPPHEESPAASPAPTRRQSGRKKVFLDPTQPHPFKSNPGTPHGPKINVLRNGVGAIRGSPQALVNGHKTIVSEEADTQDELAAVASTSPRNTNSPRAPGSIVKNRSARTPRKTTLNKEPKQPSISQSIGTRKITPAKTRGRKKTTELSDQGEEDELTIAVSQKPSEQQTDVANFETGFIDQEPRGKIKSIRGKRRTNRTDHISNRNEEIAESDGDAEVGAVEDIVSEEEDMDVDGNSVLGSVLDPTEPSPFNKPTPTLPVKNVPVSLKGNLRAGRELDLLKTIAMERVIAKRVGPLVDLEEEYKTVHQLIEHTVVAGEGNSMLLIGARGSGKTSLVNKVLTEVSKDNGEDYHVVRLNGFIHTDDKIALREIWRQLGKEMDIEEEGGQSKNYADTLTTLLALLSHPSEQTGEITDHVANAVIFVMDEFDLFATHPRQTLLYNLFDIAQSRKAPIAVLGLTTRIDVANSLEKRVKSRFSHRYVHLCLAKTFTSFQEICKASLLIHPDQLSIEERSLLSLEATPASKRVPKKMAKQDILAEWNASINSLFASKTFLTHFLAPHFYRSKSVPAVLTAFLLPTATLSPDTSSIEPSVNLQAPDSKLSLISHLSTLALSLLIGAARLDIIHDSDTCNFNMAYDEYVTLASKARIQSAAGGASASGSISKVWGKEVARREWETLVDLRLVMPVVGSGDVKGGFALVKVDVALEEIGAVIAGEKGVEKSLERWCRHI